MKLITIIHIFKPIFLIQNFKYCFCNTMLNPIKMILFLNFASQFINKYQVLNLFIYRFSIFNIAFATYILLLNNFCYIFNICIILPNNFIYQNYNNTFFY